MVTTLGLFTRLGSRRPALAALVAGVGTWSVGAYAGLGAYPYLTSMAAALLAYVAFACSERRR